MMMKPSSIILLIVLVSVFEQAQSLTNIRFEDNMITTVHTPALLSPEGYTLDAEALKAEILYSITETYFRMYKACSQGSYTTCFVDASAAIATDTTNLKFINYSGPAATIATLNADADRKQWFCPLVIKHNLAPKCDDSVARDIPNKDDTHVYKLTGNWKSGYGQDITGRAGFTAARFWFNTYDMSAAKQDFQTAVRNPGPDILVSPIMTAPQIPIANNENFMIYSDCVAIHEYRNMLRHDAKNSESVEGPIFFVIGMEVRGERIAGGTGDNIGGCGAGLTAPSEGCNLGSSYEYILKMV